MTAAVFGLIGVIVGAVLGLLREVYSDLRTRQRNARYLAARAVCVLDKYVEGCAEVAADDGLCEGQRDEDGYLRPQVPQPTPPTFPQDVDWRSIDHNLMYRLLSMPNEAEAADRKIAFIEQRVAFPPDFEELFEERQDQYSRLGLAAFALARELRQTYEIPARAVRSWDPVEQLERIKQTLEEAREKRKQLLTASPGLV